MARRSPAPRPPAPESGTKNTTVEDCPEAAAREEGLHQLLQGLRAVRDGDFSTRLPRVDDPLMDEMGTVFNGMVDQLTRFTSEVTRVAREVGSEGKLGGQAEVPGVVGAWKDLTDSVNAMAGNLTDQVRDIGRVATAVAKGDLTQKITVDVKGEVLELKDTVNTMVDQLSSFGAEVTRVAREVGIEGRLGGQATVPGVAGTWRDLTTSVNFMAGNLTDQVRSIAEVTTAVAKGDLTQKIAVDARGEILELKNTINTMVDQLSSFGAEVTRVAREVGTEGTLGGQAQVPGVAGTWRDLTTSVNFMAGNLTDQVRSIAEVATAVAKGDLTQKITVDARGEIAELKETINTMVDQLSSFADEVTRVAREVGTEGILGGQAQVEGVSGTWKRLTENVNELAGNLTRQVRAIAEVASAVARGDLTRSIDVEAQGEVADLKNYINAMVRSLRETTKANEQQAWLNTNLARISRLMQGHRDLRSVGELIMDELAPLVGAQHGTFFLAENTERRRQLRLIASYGRAYDDHSPRQIELGQTLVGQVAQSNRPVIIDETPPDFLTISTSLGRAAPVNIVVLPIKFEDQLIGVLELASFNRFTEVHIEFLQQLSESIGVIVNTIIANARTDALLEESQRLAAELRARSEELQKQQAELRRSNAELEEKAALLARQNRDIEMKNIEIEQARQELEERARQLALASKYKSEFLANMSHELRTPLTSLLILAGVLAKNPTKNLTAKQVEFANVIHSAGSDLLQLINDILDLSKVEAGKMYIHPEPFSLEQLLSYVRTTFAPQTAQKGLAFDIVADDDVPEQLVTDEQRLRQVLRNLLSNAVKFTEHGRVTLRVSMAEPDSLAETPGPVVAFSVADTGIGIAEANLEAVFGAFQQADGTTSRRYGGTGLGLSISREVAYLLGGEIRAESKLGAGSTFTLLLPVTTGATPDDEGQQLEAGTTGEQNESDVRRVLIVEPSEDDQPGPLTSLARAVVDELGGNQAPRLTSVTDADAAINALTDHGYRCAVLEISPDTQMLDVVKALTENPMLRSLPILAVVSGKLTVAQDRMLRSYARIQPMELLSSREELRSRMLLYFSADDTRDLLPLMLAQQRDEAPSADEADDEPNYDLLKGRKILLVDDDFRNVLAIAGMLEFYGMTVVHASNGRRGVEQLLANDDVDVVLMDVMMPEMDGYATTTAIRHMPRYADLPIIAVTAKAMEGDREKSLASGASDYVTKPVDADELLSCIHRWITRRDAAGKDKSGRDLATTPPAE